MNIDDSKVEVSDVYVLDGRDGFWEQKRNVANEAGVQFKCFAGAAELISDLSEGAPILVAERIIYSDFQALQDMLDKNGITSPVVACADDASIEEIANFIREGGMNFFPSPKNKNDFEIIKLYIEKNYRKHHQKNYSRIEACKKIRSLTNREREVLILLKSDSRNKVVARKLDISSRTVEIHRKHIMMKLEVHCMSAAVNVLWESQLLD